MKNFLLDFLAHIKLSLSACPVNKSFKASPAGIRNSKKRKKKKKSA
jgi:hypothetical protein